MHRATIARQWEEECNASAPSPVAAALFTRAPDSDDERGDWTPEEAEGEEVAAVEAITLAAEAESPRDGDARVHWRREQALLDQMQEIAERSRHAPDAKLRRLIDWIRAHLCPDLPPFGQAPTGPPPTWNERRVLVFTEN